MIQEDLQEEESLERCASEYAGCLLGKKASGWWEDTGADGKSGPFGGVQGLLVERLKVRLVTSFTRTLLQSEFKRSRV